MKNKSEYTESCGNVFADLGLRNPEEHLLKANLTIIIGSIIKKRRLTQIKAAKILGIDQPKVYALLSGQLSSFSIERLLRFLLMLGKDVDIVVRPVPRSRTKTRLKVV